MTIDFDLARRIRERDAKPPNPATQRADLLETIRRAYFAPPPPADAEGTRAELERLIGQLHGTTPPSAAAEAEQGAPNGSPDASADAGGSSTPSRAHSGAATGHRVGQLTESERAERAELEAQKAQLGNIAMRLLELEQKRGR